MSTIISIKNGNSYQVIDRASAQRENIWPIVARAMGYPDSWALAIRERLASDGKSWRLTNASASPLKQESMQEEKQEPRLIEGRVLLIIDGKTSQKAVDKTLHLAENSNAHVIVVYTSMPPLLGSSQTESEVDQIFARELERGRVVLSSIEREAKNLGVNAETSFIWANSSRELVRNHDFQADVVVDETA